jgi:hypothetical protein
MVVKVGLGVHEDRGADEHKFRINLTPASRTINIQAKPNEAAG